MNKIYKVIWSKVKHQYVVVSELAHSNGKQSRTSRNSIRSRIAALVVCGAIAAFGVFNTLPNSAYAADSDYIAFVTTEKGQNANENQGDTIQINGYEYTSTRIAKPDNSYTWYWVRDGYNIQLEQLERPGSDGSKDYVVRAFKDDGGEVDTSLVHSYQNKIEDTGVTTLNGKNLHSYEAGVYAGGSNGYTAVRMEDKWSEADGTFKSNNDPMIFDGKKWRQAERTDFKEVKFNEETGNYEYNGQIVATENLYVVDFVKTKGNDTDVEGTRLGCFVVDGKVYTGTVHGKNNEILMTGINEDNEYVTYWASEYTDKKATMARMPISEYNETISGLASDINAIHQDDIKEIQINQIDNGGSINLQTNGEFVPARDENGDIITDETGKPVYVAQGGKNIPGGITIRNTTNSGSEGNDVAVEISNGKNSFTVDAGSKVVGKITTKNGVEEAGVGDANKTLTGLKINGVDYALSQGKTYSNGNGISIDEENNKISVNAGDGLTFGTEQTNDEGKLKVNVGDGLSIKDGQVINNLKVTADTNATKNNKNGGNWTVTDSKANITLTNTTLDEADSNSYNSDENNLIKDDSNANNNTKYGRNYKVFDTDGNEVALNDVASADTLKTIDTTKIGNLQYNNAEGDSDETSIVKNNEDLTTAVGKLDNAVNEAKTEAGKHTKMTVNGGDISPIPENGTESAYTDGNLQLKQTEENGQTTYDVKLNDNITLGKDANQISINGNPSEGEAALSIGNKFVVEQNGSVSIKADNTETYGIDTTVTVNPDGVKFEKYGNGTTVINGQTIQAGGVAINGEDNYKGTITGLTNTTLGDGSESSTFAKAGRAATEEQLQAAMTKIDEASYKGWNVSANGENSTTVESGKIVDFSGAKDTNGDSNITVTKTVDEKGNAELAFDLNDNITLGEEGDNQININGAPEDGEAALSIGDKFVVEQNGSVSIKADNTETYGTDTTVTVNPDGVKFEKYGNGTTVINGQTIQAGGVVINGEDNGVYKGTITGLTNTTLDDETFATVGRAATEEQLKQAAAASKTTISDGKNTTVTSTEEADGHIDYKVNLNDNITLGEKEENQININGNPEAGEAALSIGDKFVVEQNGSVSIKADNTETYGTDTTVTVNPDGVKFEKYGNGTTVINGQTIQAGGVVINGEDNGVYKGTITGLTNTTLDDETFATVGRAATEEQLKQAAAASKTTISDGKNTTVTSTEEADGHIDYKVNLNDNITLGEKEENQININGNPEAGEAALSIGDKFVVEQNGSVSIKADNTETYGIDTTVTVNPDGVKFEKYGNGTTVINGQTIQAGGVVINGEDNGVYKGTITGLTNTTLDDETFATVGRAATEEQLKQAAAASKTTISDGKNTTVTSTEEADGHIDYKVNLNDNITLGEKEENQININGNPEAGEAALSIGDKFVVEQNGSVSIKADNTETYGIDTTVTVNPDGVKFEKYGNGTTVINGQTIQAGGVVINGEDNGVYKGTITGLTNTTLDDETFATVGRAATEEQLKQAAAASKTTISDGKNTTVTSTEEADGHIDYKVNLNDNITLGEKEENQININGNPEAGEAALSIGDKFVVEQNGSVSIKADNTETYGIDTTVTVNPDGVKFEKYGNGTTVINGQTIQAGGVVINGEDNGVYKGTITGLTNTTLDDETFATVGRAATEEQLKQAAAASKTTLSDGVNTTVTSNDNTPDGHVDYQVNLNDNVYLGGNNKPGSSNIELDGENGTIQVGSNIILDSKEARAVIGGVDISTTFDDIGKKSSTITGLSNTTWDTDKVVIDRAATEGQLQMVSDKVTAGWTATDDAGNKINVNPETRPTLNFASGKNITVSANEDSGEVEVSLNDNINLNDRVYINGDPEEGNNTIVDIKSGNTSKEESIFAVEDKGNGSISIGGIDITNVDGPYLAVGDGKLKFYKDGGLSTGNATGTFSVRPDGDLEISGKNSSFDVDAETGNINAENNSGSSIKMDGNGTTIAVNDGTVMGNNTTMTVNKDGVSFSAYGNGTTVIDGQTISAGGVVINNNGSGTINGLTNTTWDDELAKQVANSEELQGTAATQGQLQQAVSEVAEVANAGWNAKAGGNTINVKPNETLNFEGDGNITVSATGGTSNELKFGLNDNITLGDKESTSITLYTDPTSETTVVGTDGNTTNVTGYVPESYKSGTGADFVKNNGGFALFTTDTQGHGIFGVTTKGTAHGKDFVTYTKDIYGNDTQYSLNDVGDAVAQMSSYYNEENRKSYTVFSRYLNEAEKDNPFVTVDEDGNKINATRDIPLALRDDGAVLIGATIKGEDFTDNGIRINAETETTYDEDGNEVTNNIATITGLENTEWTPPAPVATFANEGTETSRAATEAQLNDLYGTVVGYNVDTDGVNYGTVTLGGGRTSYDKDTHEGGTVLNNVAYASGTDGSEAVNVDYLNDAINNAVKDGGAISDSDRHLQEGTYHVNDQGEVELIVADEKGENRSTVTIDNIANKNDITNLDNKIDNTFNDLNDKINNIDNVETDVKGGNINEDGTISLKTENEDGTTTNVTLKGQLTDSGVVQEGTTFDKETGTLTITSQDKYSGETSSVKVEGIASTEVVGATNKEDLATAYKDADKDGNATTEYITDSESMVEADVALDHAIQDVAGTSYANDMVLSNRIDSVEKRLGNVEERIDKVGAMAAAIANLRTMGFDPEAPTEIAIGVGQYKSETGIAIGVFHYPNQDFMLSASLSSSGDELMGGIGATWKLGRKSAAERAKDEEARHLEQAEEMKKLAQQEKVKAQAQRHAKLLAERQQASQKNA